MTNTTTAPATTNSTVKVLPTYTSDAGAYVGKVGRVADLHVAYRGLEETVVATVVFPEGTTGVLPWVVSIPHEDLVAI